MSRLARLSGLALRDLWIGLRLLPAVGVLLLSGLPAILLPHVAASDMRGAPPSTLTWFALAIAVALALVAAIAAASLAFERHRGTAAWLTLRAVPRATILLAWFAAFTLLVVAGLLPAAFLAWFSLDTVTGSSPGTYAAAMVAVVAAGLCAVAAGLLVGSFLPPRIAAAVTLLLCAAALGGPMAPALAGASPLPFGVAPLATLDELARPAGDALNSGGLALAVTAVLLIVAVGVWERVDL